MNAFELRKTRDFGQIITDTFTYIRVHFRTLGKALFLFVFPIVLISGALISSSFISIFDVADLNSTQPINPTSTDDMASFLVRFFIGLILFMINFLLIYVIVF